MNFKRLINIFLFLIIFPALCYGSTYKIRAFKYLTGGVDTSYVDGIDGADLNVGDLGLVITSTGTYFYEVDNSGVAESSPDVIAPDSNPGNKRWRLRNTYSITEHETTYNHANYDTAYGWGDHSIAGYALQTITLTAGEGLSGGGDLSANRSFAFDINGLVADGSPDGAADYVATYDADAGTHKKVLLDDLPGGVTDHGALTGLGDDDHTQYALIDGSRDFTGSINLDTVGTDEYQIGGNRALAIPEAESIALGENALSSLTSGVQLVAIGKDALASTTSGGHHIAIGEGALKNNVAAHYNIGIGRRALYGAAASTAQYDVSIGYNSMYYASSASRDVAIGWASMAACTSCYNNVGIGDSSLISIVTGHDNFGLGRNTLSSLTGGIYNVIIGSQGARNIVNDVGNIGFGYLVLDNVNGGDYDIAIGHQAGDNITTANYCLIVGANIDAPSATADYQLSIYDTFYGIMDNGTYGIGGSTFDGTGRNTFQITDSTQPSGSIADTVQFYEKDSSQGAGHGTLGLYLEESVEALGTFTPANKMRVWINGTEYWIQLDPV